MTNSVRKVTYWIAGGVLAVALVALWLTDTWSYPLIMLSRQIQLIRDCAYPETTFISPDHGFAFAVPAGYCALPHRRFPEDGTIQIVPGGWYFVINEYAYGSVARVSEAAVFMERTSTKRNRSAIIDAMTRGGFFADAPRKDLTNESELAMTTFANVRGVDEESRYNWAFIESPDGSALVTAVTDRVADPRIFDAVVASVRPHSVAASE